MKEDITKRHEATGGSPRTTTDSTFSWVSGDRRPHLPSCPPLSLPLPCADATLDDVRDLDPGARLVQAGHEVILQVESDDRCAQVLRAQFPRARLARQVASLSELPAETEVLAAALPWPETDDDDLRDRPTKEHPWLPASRAAALKEHAHIFRLLAGRPVSWVLLELPVSLLRWATAAVPGKGKPTRFFFSEGVRLPPARLTTRLCLVPRRV